MSKITFYAHSRSGPSYRVGLALALMQLPHGFELVDLPGGGTRTPEYMAKSRFGNVPCLQDGDLYIVQSAAILEHLAALSGKFGGASPAECARIREWLYWDFDRLAPGLFRSRAFKQGIRKAEPAVVEFYKAEGEAGLAVLDNWLTKHQWLANDRLTIADISIYPGVYYAEDGGFDLSKYPGVSAWKARIEALPGYGKPAEVMPAASRA
ncbi:MAG: glutathione S-transferase family protein [Xanthobacteraceae bacterium]